MAEEQRMYTEEEVQQLLARNAEQARTGMFTQEQVNGIVADRLKRSRDTLEHYRAEMAAKAAEQAEADALRERFDAAMGTDREPIHPRLEALMLDDFSSAVKDPANAGKDDSKVFMELFNDQGYFKPAGAKLFTGTPGSLPRPNNAVTPDPIAKAFGLEKGK